MPIVSQPEAPTASPAIDEQSISPFCHVEIMRDLDDGRATLCIATEPNLGDFREVSPARALGVIENVEALIVEAKRLIREFEARDTLAAILAEHDLHMVEVDMAEVAAFGADLAPHLGCWAGEDNGRLTVWVPKEQDPVTRANALAALVNDPGSVVQEG